MQEGEYLRWRAGASGVFGSGWLLCATPQGCRDPPALHESARANCASPTAVGEACAFECVLPMVGVGIAKCTHDADGVPGWLIEGGCALCDAGEYVLGSDKEASCEACPLGTYNELQGQIGSGACSHCPNGTFGTEIGGRSLSSCEDCPAYATRTGLSTGMSDCIFPEKGQNFSHVAGTTLEINGVVGQNLRPGHLLGVFVDCGQDVVAGIGYGSPERTQFPTGWEGGAVSSSSQKVHLQEAQP